MPGVVDVVSGYIGGEGDRPNYQYVSMGRSNHAEAVRIVYDPATVSYKQLLDMFWKIHNPTTLNRQGYDIGTQYRSAIFYIGEEQKSAALSSIQGQQPKWASKIVTEVSQADKFWIAEEYHQDFFRNNPDYGYCVAVVAPKVEKSGLAQ
jgi:peptide-methionine (S)-S-oxide reductase